MNEIYQSKNQIGFLFYSFRFYTLHLRQDGFYMTKERKKSLLYLLILDVSLLIFTLLFFLFFKPDEIISGKEGYTCIFQRLFSIYCPACGGTRAVGYLLSFKIKEAFIYYPPLFVGLILVTWLNFIYIRSFIKSDLSYIEKHKYYEFISIPVSILLFFIIRNILLLFGIDYIHDII